MQQRHIFLSEELNQLYNLSHDNFQRNCDHFLTNKSERKYIKMRPVGLFHLNANLATVIILISSSAVFGVNVSQLREKWEGVSDGLDQINAQKEAEAQFGEIPNKQVTDPNRPRLTPTLVAWVSGQSEGIVLEMEAIAKQNAESSKFSVVNYLRYLKLYDSLKVVARQPIDELYWVKRKAKVFGKIYHSATEIVSAYLSDLDLKLSKVEEAEPKGKAKQVNNDWIELYESIKYIATHAPNGSELAKAATEMMLKSPNNTSDKMRSTRYQLKTHAFNRK